MNRKFFLSIALLSIVHFYSFSLEKKPEVQLSKTGKVSKNNTSIAIYTSNGIEFTFRNVKKDYVPGKTSFYDIWSLWEAFENTNGTREARIIAPGEWETALKINNDFVGGLNHGFERKTSIQFTIDGKSIAENENFDLKPFKRFIVAQESDLYAFNSTSNKIATITKTWNFNDEGEIEFHQKIKWLSTQDLSNSYLTMLPVARDYNGVNISSKAKRDDINEVFDVSDQGHINPLGPSKRNKDASSITLWGDAYRFNVSIKRKEILPNSSLWLSNSKLYNKIYFDYSGKHTVREGEIFDLKTIFRVDKI